MKPLLISGAVAAMLVCLAPGPARACAFHGLLGNGFSAQFPGSIDVAIALRDAADTGIVEPASLLPKKVDLFAYHRTVQRLQKLRDVFDVAQLSSFSVLLVESALWSRYTSKDDKTSVAVHTEGPLEGAPVVLTGEAAIVAIEAGTLTWQDALARKLVVIVPAEGEAARHQTR